MKSTIIRKCYREFTHSIENVDQLLSEIRMTEDQDTAQCLAEDDLVDLCMSAAVHKYKLVEQYMNGLLDVFVDMWNERAGEALDQEDIDDLGDRASTVFDYVLKESGVSSRVTIISNQDEVYLGFHLFGFDFPDVSFLMETELITYEVGHFLQYLIDDNCRYVKFKCKRGSHLLDEYHRILPITTDDFVYPFHDVDLDELKKCYENVRLKGEDCWNVMEELERPIEIYNQSLSCLGYEFTYRMPEGLVPEYSLGFIIATKEKQVSCFQEGLPEPEDLIKACEENASNIRENKDKLMDHLRPSEQEEHTKLLREIDKSYFHLLRSVEAWKQSVAAKIAPVIFQCFLSMKNNKDAILDKNVIYQALEPYSVFEIDTSSGEVIACSILADKIFSHDVIEYTSDFRNHNMTCSVFTLRFYLPRASISKDDMRICVYIPYMLLQDFDKTMEQAIVSKYAIFQGAEHVIASTCAYNKAVDTFNAVDPFQDEGYLLKLVCHRNEDVSFFNDEEYRTVLSLSRILIVDGEII